MEIKKILCKLNGNPKTVYSRKELISEYKTYNNLNSLSIIIILKNNSEIKLSLLSACNFIITGKIQENIIKNLI